MPFCTSVMFTSIDMIVCICFHNNNNIERTLRNTQTIYTPNEYALAVGKARKVNPFKVHEMQNADFVTVDPVLQCITQRTTTKEGCKVQFRNITQLMVCQNDPWVLHFRHSHYDTTWQRVGLRKNEDVSSL